MSDGVSAKKDFETRLRREAMAWLTVRTDDGLGPISRRDLLDFTIDGKMFRLMDPTRGIRKPKELSSALSITTTYHAAGATSVRGSGRLGRATALQVVDDQPKQYGQPWTTRGHERGRPVDLVLRCGAEAVSTHLSGVHRRGRT